MSEEELNQMSNNELIGIIKAQKFEINQLENIRKEAIDYVYKHIQEYDADDTFTNLDEFDFIASPQTLLNILNKGSDKDGDNTNETSTGETEK